MRNFLAVWANTTLIKHLVYIYIRMNFYTFHHRKLQKRILLRVWISLLHSKRSVFRSTMAAFIGRAVMFPHF